MNSTLWVPSETKDQKTWKLRKKPIIQVNGCDCSQRVYFGSSYYSDFLWKSPSLNYLVVIVYLSFYAISAPQRPVGCILTWFSILTQWFICQWSLTAAPICKKFTCWLGRSMSSENISQMKEVCWLMGDLLSSNKSSWLQ